MSSKGLSEWFRNFCILLILRNLCDFLLYIFVDLCDLIFCLDFWVKIFIFLFFLFFLCDFWCFCHGAEGWVDDIMSFLALFVPFSATFCDW